MRCVYSVAAILLVLALPIHAEEEGAPDGESAKEFATILRLKVAGHLLETVQAAERPLPSFEKAFRSVDMKFLQELDASARELMPQKDAWGTRLQVLHHNGRWVLISAGPDGEFRMPRLLEQAVAAVERARETDSEPQMEDEQGF